MQKTSKAFVFDTIKRNLQHSDEPTLLDISLLDPDEEAYDDYEKYTYNDSDQGDLWATQSLETSTRMNIQWASSSTVAMIGSTTTLHPHSSSKSSSTLTANNEATTPKSSLQIVEELEDAKRPDALLVLSDEDEKMPKLNQDTFHTCDTTETREHSLDLLRVQGSL